MHISELPVKAPKGYHYEITDHNTRMYRVMLVHERKYEYNNGKKVATIWGFISKKSNQIYAPVNAKTVGDVANRITPYTTMEINYV
jgi:hypothetical protein